MGRRCPAWGPSLTRHVPLPDSSPVHYRTVVRLIHYKCDDQHSHGQQLARPLQRGRFPSLRAQHTLMFRSLRNGAIVPSVPLNQSVDIDHQTGGHIGEKSKGERRYVARLDAVLLVFVCISQVIKYLDQSSKSDTANFEWILTSDVSAAYVSGMKEGMVNRTYPFVQR